MFKEAARLDSAVALERAHSKRVGEFTSKKEITVLRSYICQRSQEISIFEPTQANKLFPLLQIAKSQARSTL